MVRWRGALVLVAALMAATLFPPSALGAPAGVGYVAPVSPSVAVVTDHFRAPPNPYAAGNRGLDYATVPGSIVVAAAAGRVIFAGPVAGTRHLTIAHPDGLRTSYSFLAQILVAVGQVVAQGQPVGVTGSVFHFGVRDGDGTYLDPEALLAGRLGAHLVPGPDEGAVSQAGPGPSEEPARAAMVADRARVGAAARPAARSRDLDPGGARAGPSGVPGRRSWLEGAFDDVAGRAAAVGEQVARAVDGARAR